MYGWSSNKWGFSGSRSLPVVVRLICCLAQYICFQFDIEYVIIFLDHLNLIKPVPTSRPFTHAKISKMSPLFARAEQNTIYIIYQTLPITLTSQVRILAFQSKVAFFKWS